MSWPPTYYPFDKGQTTFSVPGREKSGEKVEMKKDERERSWSTPHPQTRSYTTPLPPFSASPLIATAQRGWLTKSRLFAPFPSFSTYRQHVLFNPEYREVPFAFDTESPIPEGVKATSRKVSPITGKVVFRGNELLPFRARMGDFGRKGGKKDGGRDGGREGGREEEVKKERLGMGRLLGTSEENEKVRIWGHVVQMFKSGGCITSREVVGAIVLEILPAVEHFKERMRIVSDITPASTLDSRGRLFKVYVPKPVIESPFTRPRPSKEMIERVREALRVEWDIPVFDGPLELGDWDRSSDDGADEGVVEGESVEVGGEAEDGIDPFEDSGLEDAMEYSSLEDAMADGAIDDGSIALMGRTNISGDDNPTTQPTPHPTVISPQSSPKHGSLRELVPGTEPPSPVPRGGIPQPCGITGQMVLSEELSALGDSLDDSFEDDNTSDDANSITQPSPSPAK